MLRCGFILVTPDGKKHDKQTQPRKQHSHDSTDVLVNSDPSVLKVMLFW